MRWRRGICSRSCTAGSHPRGDARSPGGSRRSLSRRGVSGAAEGRAGDAREVAARSDAVLVDVRRFGRARADSASELGGLLDTADLARVVFVVADGDDQRLLAATLDRCWSRLAADSPNRRPGAHVARLVGDPADSPAALRALLGILAS